MVINRINKYIILILILLSFVEFYCFSTTDGVGALLFTLSWLILSKTVFIYKNIIEHTIPFFVLFSYAICFFFLPLICTLIEFKPLTYNFKVPIETLIHQFFFLMTLILAFQVMTKMGKNKVRSFLMVHTRLFVPISNKELWTLGFIGLFCFTFSIFAPATSFVGKVTDGLRFLTAAPILLLFPALYTGRLGEKSKKNTIRYVIFYCLIYIILGMARNSRMAMLFLMVDAAMIFFIYLLIYNVSFKSIIKIKYFIVLLLGGYILSGPLSDIGIAMVGVRSTRSDVDPITLMKNTWSFYQSDDFEKFKKNFYMVEVDRGNDKRWSEDYIDHVFLNRLCNLRVSDATLYYANNLGYDNPDMKKAFFDQLLANLPAGLTSSSFKDSTRFSAGDKLYALSTGFSEAIGGYRVAGYTGLGMATFGLKFYAISFFFYILCFYLLDAFSFNMKGKLLVSVFGLLQTNNWFYFLNNGAGILRNMSYLCRNYYQDVILFILVLFLVRSVFKRSM